jgi:hypothetical protein
MKINSPSAADCLLPATGASTNSLPAATTVWASSFTHVTVSVLHSTTNAAGSAPASAPSLPSHIDRDAASSATMLKIISAPFAASRGLDATRAPSAANASAFVWFRL